jgi:hypothetical protein
MTHLTTDWINEDLELKIGEIRSHAARLSSDDLEALEQTLAELQNAVGQLREMLHAMPHRHA